MQDEKEPEEAEKGPDTAAGAEPAPEKTEKKKKDGFWRGYCAGILTAAGILAAVLIVGGFAVNRMGGLSNLLHGSGGLTAGLDRQRIDDKLDVIQKTIDDNYLFTDRVNTDTMEDYIYLGAMASLGDPYSTYYSKKDTEDFKKQTTGSYVGIGAMVNQSQTDGRITVVRVFKDSPAEKAGLLAGDELAAIGSTDLSTITLDKVVSDYILGEEGTDVTITIYRPSTGETMDLTFTRAKVESETVFTKMLDNGIGYLELTEFSTASTDQFKKAVDDLESQGMQKLVLDLRDNPGGDLEVLTTIADYLVEDGKTIIRMADKNGNGETYTTSDGHSVDVPIVVLVNGNTASAAEALTGCLKDNGKAKVVGSVTFGKGIVQKTWFLNDGSALKLTVDHYYTPDGTDIQGHGITPDYPVDLTTAKISAEAGDIAADPDAQLAKAIEILNAG